ncbi:hypothetical protein B0T21DRAFT_356961 [Apiosordaria backusii]|uniref:Uncharacterized protein n=1 Tax=Apiosordaria backusii TaxID=314023 RepID=A0AA40K7C1_9PEZI|nr:hypothetical protein B0T21DRAFT_356961 [Apiosordaria backusii]
MPLVVCSLRSLVRGSYLVCPQLLNFASPEHSSHHHKTDFLSPSLTFPPNLL